MLTVLLSLGGIFDVDRKERRLEEVNREVENPELWDDPKRAQEISKEQKLLEDLVGSFKRLSAGITDAKELEKHTYIKTRNPAVFPKKERLGLAQRMMNEASDLVADLMEANDLLLTDPEERELRYRAQRSALRNCRKLIHHIELAHEILSGFSDDAFAYWAKMAAGVKNQTAKWYKTDKERAAKLDAQKRHQ